MPRSSKNITIGYLYADEMNIYGDTGNVQILKKRFEWRGYEVRVDYISAGKNTSYDFRKVDLLFSGGGQDRGQLVVAEDLRARRKALEDAFQDNLPMLLICGSYQLFGEYFLTKEKVKIEGIGLLPLHTVATEERMIGNVVINSPFGKILGFENHSGATFLDNPNHALGEVVYGFGNNLSDKLEGCLLNNCFGTYMHGPLLSKNPELADEIIRRTLSRKYNTSEVKLETVDDKFALMAKNQMLKRL